MRCTWPAYPCAVSKISPNCFKSTKVSSGTISHLNQKAYKHIEEWRQRPLTGEYPYVYVDGIYLKRCWGGEIQNVSVLVAIGVNKDGFREILEQQKA